MRNSVKTMAALLLLAAILPCPRLEAAAVHVLPRWAGSFNVGTLTRALHDATRREIFTRDTGDTRRLAVQVFYPTDAACVAHSFFPGEVAALYAVEFGFTPGFETSIRSEACPDAAPLRTGRRFPLVLFSHGLGQTRFSYTAILEDLASHGNIVVAIEHPYGSGGAIFPDGTLLRWDNQLWSPSGRPGIDPAAAKEYYRIWADDARFVLDVLTSRESSFLPPPLQRQVDVTRIAYLGHSYGGMAAIYAAQRDSRIRGAVNLDGALINNTMPAPITADVPILALHSPGPLDVVPYGPSVRAVAPTGMSHMSFSDFEWLAGLFGRQSREGPHPAEATTTGLVLTRELLRLFLDCSFEARCAALDARLAEVSRPAPANAPAPPHP